MKNSMTLSKKALFGSLLASSLVAASTSVMAKQESAAKPSSAEKTTMSDRVITGSYAGWNDPVMGKVAIYSGQALINQKRLTPKTLI